MNIAAIRQWHAIPSIMMLLALWQAAAMIAGSRLFPTPVAVLEALRVEIASGALLTHLGISLARVAFSFVIAMIAGTALGLALGRSAVLDRWLHPWLVILLNVPALVIIILTYVWLGLTETALLVAVAANKIPSVAVTIREGREHLIAIMQEVAQIYRFGSVKKSSGNRPAAAGALSARCGQKWTLRWFGRSCWWWNCSVVPTGLAFSSRRIFSFSTCSGSWRIRRPLSCVS